MRVHELTLVDTIHADLYAIDQQECQLRVIIKQFSPLPSPSTPSSLSQRHCRLLSFWTLRSCCLYLLLQVFSILRQPRRAYHEFSEPEPWSAGAASLLRDRLCGAVFRLLYGDRRWHCTLSSDNSRSICSISDVSTDRRNIHHRPALWWRFTWFWRRIQN